MFGGIKKALAGLLSAAVVISSIPVVEVYAASPMIEFPEVHQADQIAQGLFQNYITIPTGDGLGAAWFQSSDNRTSLCLQEAAGDPASGGKYTEIGTDAGSTLYNTFSMEAVLAVRNIIENSLLFQPYWENKGIPWQCTRQNAQIAIWYVMDALGQPGSGGWTTEQVKNGSLGNRVSGVDAVGQLNQLIQVGLSGKNIADPSVEVTYKSTAISGNNFVMTYQVQASYLTGWQISFQNLPTNTSFKIDGVTANLENGYLKKDINTGTSTITLTFPISGNMEKTISVIAYGITERNSANFHFFKPRNAGKQWAGVVSSMERLNDPIETDGTTPTVTGTLELEKKDESTGAALAGAVYGIYTDSACQNLFQQLAVTDSSGKTSANIKIGQYFVKEISAPAGYAYNNTVYPVTVSNGQTIKVAATDVKQKITLIVTKIDADTKVKIKGASFAVFSSPALNNKIADLTDKGDGTYEVTGLAPGTYYLKETKAPSGYALSPEVTTINLSGDTTGNVQVERNISVTNTKQSGTLTVVKTDKEDGTALDGAAFSLYSDPECTNKVYDLTGVGNGTYRQTGIPLGQYYLKETKAPPGYALSSEIIEVVIEGDDTGAENVTIEKQWTNQKQVYNLIVKKTDKETGEVLTGATYVLYMDLDCTVPYTVMTDKGDGTYEALNVDQGTYYLREDAAPIGYMLDSVPIKIELLGNILGAEVVKREIRTTNQKKTGTVTVDKYDKDSRTLLTGAEFTLYTDPDCTMPYMVLADKGDGTYEALNVGQGTYYLKETAAPAGYDVDSKIIQICIDRDNVESNFHYEFENEKSIREVTVSKKIKASDIVWAHGNPTFLLTLDGVDLDGQQHIYHKAIEFTQADVGMGNEYIEKAVTFQVIAGNYVLTEGETNRYNFDSFYDVVNGVVSEKTCQFDLINHPSASTGIYNVKTDQSGTSHTYLVSNYFNSVVYTVLFTADGTAFDTQILKEGDAIADPGIPQKDGYKFAGWSPAFTPGDKCVGNITYTAQFEKIKPVLEPGYDFNMHIPNDAAAVVFSDAPAPNKAKLTDVSAAKDGSVVSWLDGTTLYISSQKSGLKIAANEDSSSMFRDKSNLAYIDVSMLDTSSVIQMYSAFENTGSYVLDSFSIIGLDNWDVSSLQSTEYMFSGTGSSASNWSIGDLSRWNTCNVSSTESMFSGAGYNAASWTVGDLGRWNMSKNGIMRSMFYGAGHNAASWTVGDLSRWDTHNVGDFSYIFCEAGYNTSWTVGDLSSWDTSNNYDFGGMFEGCRGLSTTITVRNYANYADMFKDAATLGNAKIVVNYTSTTSEIIDAMIATKSSGSNVVKGVLVD
ncbi:SpaA isopeptide-forming pilin-related protein [Cuneatibacter caecimuris]|uniref:List-Bact-rpt repeat protein n=1 Tax=Cuneatibacter caecimuris TaxID=1796618 RepID=A0A4Q7PKH2_9FIRM|nr:SpaA isopeptide-forming pilin-related protein [Cuneatibacter caecimuris]RZT01186.1 List-Bact-rpt repeat protein [Cuneatibacter caecimuris]